MVFGMKRKRRSIADFDFDVRDGWYPVDLESDSGREWLDTLVREVAPELAQRDLVRAELAAVRERLLAAADPRLTAAVYLPPGEPAHVKCVLAFRTTELSDTDSPESYLAALDEDEERSGPGERYNIVKTWTVRIDAGLAVGAYNLITYTDPGDAFGRPEARVVIGVFVDGAAQMLEFIFTTQDIAGFDDFVDMAMGCVATLTVELGS